MFLPTLATVLGCWLHMRQPQLWPSSSYAAMAACAMLALLALAALRVHRAVHAAWLARTRGLLAACAIAELVFGLAGWRAVPRLHDRLAPPLWGGTMRVQGVVQGLPARTPSGLRFVFAPTPGQAPGLPARLLVSWPRVGAAALPRLRAGQGWSLPLRLRPPHGLANPGGFDSELWLFAQGLGGTASVLRGGVATPPVRCPRLDHAGPWQRVQLAREAQRQRLFDALPGDPRAGTLAALALGDQASVGAQEWQVYRSTGVAHLMAISGLHITMQAWLAGLALGAAWRRARWRGVALPLSLPTTTLVGVARLVGALAYGLAAGMGVPAQRAVLMLALAVLLRLGARRAGPGSVLGAALCAVLLWDPWAVLQPGLWLSFCAVGVLVLSDADAPAVPADEPAPVGWRGAWRRLRRAARAQWAVTVALMPLTLLFFQQVAWLSPLANAFAIPVVTLGVVPLAVAGLLLPAPLDALAWQLAARLQDGVLHALGLLAAWPHAQAFAPSPAPLALAFALPGVLALALPWPWRLRLPGLALLAPLLLQPPARPAQGHVQAWLADVGQGSAVIVRTRRHTLVFDSGPPMGPGQDAGGRALLPLLRQLGERRLDLVVLSHADIDHVGGAATLAQAYPATAAVGSVGAARLLNMGFASAARCQRPLAWDWDGVHFEWLHPLAGAPLREDNAGSCVLRVQGGRRLAAAHRGSGAAPGAGAAGAPRAARAPAQRPAGRRAPWQPRLQQPAVSRRGGAARRRRAGRLAQPLSPPARRDAATPARACAAAGAHRPRRRVVLGRRAARATAGLAPATRAFLAMASRARSSRRVAVSRNDARPAPEPAELGIMGGCNHPTDFPAAPCSCSRCRPCCGPETRWSGDSWSARSRRWP